jgi:hypothetical protein
MSRLRKQRRNARAATQAAEAAASAEYPAPIHTCWRCEKPIDDRHPFGPDGHCICVYPIVKNGKPPADRAARWTGLSDHIIKDVVSTLEKVSS